MEGEDDIDNDRASSQEEANCQQQGEESREKATRKGPLREQHQDEPASPPAPPSMSDRSTIESRGIRSLTDQDDEDAVQLLPSNPLFRQLSPKPRRSPRSQQRRRRRLSFQPDPTPPQQPQRRRSRDPNGDYFVDLYNTAIGSDNTDVADARPSTMSRLLIISDNHSTHRCERWCNEYAVCGLPPLDSYCCSPLDEYCQQLLSTCGMDANDTTILQDDPTTEVGLDDSLHSLELGLLEELRDANVAARTSSSTLPDNDSDNTPIWGQQTQEDDSNHSLSVDEVISARASLWQAQEGQLQQGRSASSEVARRMIEESYMSVDIEKQQTESEETKISPNSVLDIP